MSKVVISPLLNSLFSRTSGMTKDEANNLVDVLAVVGSEDTKIVMAQSTSRKMGNANYLTIHDSDNDYDMLSDEIEDILEDSGFMFTETKNGCGGTFWIYFIRK